MKRIFLFQILVLFLLCPFVSLGQETIYYKYTYSVDPKTGVKRSNYRSPEYYTFVNNYNTVYKSDARGNKAPNMNGPMTSYGGGFYCDHIYNFVGENNGMLVYACKWANYNGLGYFLGGGTYYITFSKDLQRINVDMGYSVDVGEKSDLPGQEAPPSKMW